MKVKKSNYFNNPTLARAQIKSALDNLTPQIYSAVALAIWENLPESTEEDKTRVISEIFSTSQEIWTDLSSKGLSTNDMIDLCYETTGILVASKRES